MKERGRLINTVLKSELSNLEPAIAPSLGSYGKDYAVSSSDGQGNKVEAPWVRFCSEEMSPNAQNGYYVVIHFKKDGTVSWNTWETVWAVEDCRARRKFFGMLLGGIT